MSSLYVVPISFERYAAPSLGSHLMRCYAIKARLVPFTDIRPLFDLDHLHLLKDLETMPSRDKKNNIPAAELPALQIFPLLVIKVNLEPSFTDKQHFLRIVNLTRHRIVDVRLYHFPNRVVHIGQLLRKVRLGKKMDAGFAEICPDDNRQGFFSTKDFFQILSAHFNSNVSLVQLS